MQLAWDLFDESPTLVLLHAFPLDRRMWAAQVGELAEVARVVTLDLPGFGASRDTRVRPDLDAWADAVESSLAELIGEEPVVLCGLSMGGYVALRIADRHPGRLEGLILADTRAGADSTEGAEAREQAIDHVNRHGVEALADQLIPKLFSPEADREATSFARELALDQAPEAVTGALQAMRDRPDSTAVLDDLRVPALIIVGEVDELTPPAEAESMARRIGNAWLVKIPGAGHLTNIEAPEQFNAAIKGFLAAM